ncbi:MAG TPA: hypothetical protein PKC40_14595, partial [Saprospiraceae bacterium]|nr:hypothetical protein [Saprospiraceae bacterium]
FNKPKKYADGPPPACAPTPPKEKNPAPKADETSDGVISNNEAEKLNNLLSTPPETKKPEGKGSIGGFEDGDGDGDHLIDDAIIDEE